jgi:hypothetical protein
MGRLRRGDILDFLGDSFAAPWSEIEEVLGELGYSDEEIGELAADGVMPSARGTPSVHLAC